jgi:histidine ammonia-lyase
LRAQVPALAEDRYFHPDMAKATAIIRSGALAELTGLPGLA